MTTDQTLLPEEIWVWKVYTYGDLYGHWNGLSPDIRGVTPETKYIRADLAITKDEERDLTTAYMAGQASNYIEGAQEAYDGFKNAIIQRDYHGRHFIPINPTTRTDDLIETIKRALIAAGAKA